MPRRGSGMSKGSEQRSASKGSSSSSSKKKKSATRQSTTNDTTASSDDASSSSSSSSSSPYVCSLLPSVPSPTPPCGRLLFLTVGTTDFDSLICALNDSAVPFLRWCVEHHFERIIIQMGRGKIQPIRLIEECNRMNQTHAAASSSSAPLLRVEYFLFSPAIVSFIVASSLVLSHAGAGSILESLRAHKPLLVLINDTLMHNHQTQVAQALQEEKVLYQSSTANFMHVLREGNWSDPITPQEARARNTEQTDTQQHYQLLEYPPVDLDAFPALLAQTTRTLTHSTTEQRINDVLLTIIMPAVVALAITWKLFA